MLINYIKVAIRSFTRQKLTAGINIAGLALSILCCLTIYFYIDHELGYDRYHTRAERIYRVTRNFLSADGSVSLHLGHVAPPFGPLLENDFADIEKTGRTLKSTLLLAVEEANQSQRSFVEREVYTVEPSLLSIFSIEVMLGDPIHALDRPFCIMLSDKMAMKYFGTEDVVGQHIRAEHQQLLEVTGVFQSFPDQSHWHPDFLVSFSTLYDDRIYGRQALETNWDNNAFCTYLLTSDTFDPKKTAAAFPAFLDKHMGADTHTWTTLFLQRLTDIHLYSHLDSEVEANGNIRNVYMMGLIGLFILLIAVVNFVNLSTARATKRSKEVGLRKVAGAYRFQLWMQYLTESVLTAFVALAIALALSPGALQWLRYFTGQAITLADYLHVYPVLAVLGFTLLVGILAGLYPAVVISSYRPALILKGQQSTTGGHGPLRKVLVTLQFTISIVLIIATAVMLQQLRFMNRQSLGYDKDQVVSIPYYGDDLGDTYAAFHHELTQGAAVQNVSRSSIIPTLRLLDSQGTRVMQGDSLNKTDVVMKDVRIDDNFFDTYGVPIVAGRNFSSHFTRDDSLGFIINEAAVEMIGWTNESAIGQTIQNGGVTGHVVGVVKNFHFESLHEPIVPIIFHIEPYYRRLSVRLAGKDLQAGLAHLAAVWKTFLPHRPFEYHFLSDQYAALYASEQHQSQLFIIFSLLAIFIACLGLLGLVTYSTLQRVREIGIRKVLGASIFTILKLLSKEIVLLLIIANVLACPIAWYFMRSWLDGFAYHVDVNPLLYLSTGGLALFVALATVSTQTLRAALGAPAETLRHQ